MEKLYKKFVKNCLTNKIGIVIIRFTTKGWCKLISMQGASVLTLYAILIVAVVQDITSMRISNRLIIMGLFLSMAFGIVLGGMPRIIQVLLNISIPVIMLYLFYLIGVLGAGDIKLFSVIGGFTNLKTLTDCVLAAFVAGAVIAVLKMLYMRNLRISLFKAQVFLRELFSGKFSSYRNGWVQEQNLMHFSCLLYTSPSPRDTR